jgi:hypothetical protein
MKRIYKYSFAINGKEQEGDWYWTLGATSFVAMQPERCMDAVCLWQTLKDHAVPERRIFKVVATGEDFTDEWSRIGTALDPRGLVWHLLLKGP